LGFAGTLGAGESEPVAQEFEQGLLDRNFARPPSAVHCQRQTKVSVTWKFIERHFHSPGERFPVLEQAARRSYTACIQNSPKDRPLAARVLGNNSSVPQRSFRRHPMSRL